MDESESILVNKCQDRFGGFVYLQLGPALLFAKSVMKGIVTYSPRLAAKPQMISKTKPTKLTIYPRKT